MDKVYPVKNGQLLVIKFDEIVDKKDLNISFDVSGKITVTAVFRDRIIPNIASLFNVDNLLTEAAAYKLENELKYAAPYTKCFLMNPNIKGIRAKYIDGVLFVLVYSNLVDTHEKPVVIE